MATPGSFLTAEWRWLAMLNFACPPDLLLPCVPHGTELDAWEGRHFVSVVGFRFLHTRVRGIPIPFHRDFEEINLRFYVRRRVGGETRRGVVFVQEIVPRRAIAWVARTLYGENYVRHPMRHEVTMPPGGHAGCGGVRYGFRPAQEWMWLSARVAGPPRLPRQGELAAFIAEHYWGYARQRDGSTVEYQVEHPPWRVWDASSARLEGDVPGYYGPSFSAVLRADVASAFVAEGSPVRVRRGIRLTDRI